MVTNAHGETVHPVGARVRHRWLGESGVVVRSWPAAMVVRRDDGSKCQVSHRDWVEVDVLRQAAVREAWRVMADMHPDSAAAVQVAARYAVGAATDQELAAAREMARAVARDCSVDRDWQVALVAVATVARQSDWAEAEAKRLVSGLRLALEVVR